MTNQFTLSQLGWNHFFQQQLSLEDWESNLVARVAEQQRSQLTLVSEEHQTFYFSLHSGLPQLVIGDWLLLDQQKQFLRRLDRSTLFSRKAAGSKVSAQPIAANIDLALIVSAMNRDFSLNRLERYMALAYEVGVEPIIVLSKADLCDDPSHYIEQVRTLSASLEVFAINALDYNSARPLLSICRQGKTAALLGSSGVGKSTLINTLSGKRVQHTQPAREQDDEGRHTTTCRSIIPLKEAGLLMDSPGMRELQLTECEHGLEVTFSDIAALATRCRFSDCSHQSEPGCAVQSAIADGVLSERRLASFQKLDREQARNKATLAELREKDRKFSRHCRSVMKSKQKKMSLFD